MNENKWKEFWENIFRITLCSFLLVVPVLYVGYLMRINPTVWAPVAAVVCFYVSHKIVKKFFWKKFE